MLDRSFVRGSGNGGEGLGLESGKLCVHAWKNERGASPDPPSGARAENAKPRQRQSDGPFLEKEAELQKEEVFLVAAVDLV